MEFLKTGLFDTHCHLNDVKHYKGLTTLTSIISRCEEFKLSGLLCCGTNMKDTKLAYHLSLMYTNIFCAGGLHPQFVNKNSLLTFNDYQTLRKYANFEKFVAIGEIGLDYYHPVSDEIKSLQTQQFKKQIELALSLNLPIIVHTRNAHHETIEILSQYSKLTGIIHCFAGTIEIARKYIELGFYISFSGTITFNKNDKLREVAKHIPLSYILAETDSPYLSPQIVRGQINYPYNVKYVVQELAKIKGLSYDKMTTVIFNNTLNAFKLNKSK